MIEQMMNGFVTSPEGQQAQKVLASKGFSVDQVKQIMHHVTQAASGSLHQQTHGHAEPAVGLLNVFGGHAGREFLMGAVAGLIKGDGLVGSLKDGGMGMLTGHIAEWLAPRLNVDPEVAGGIAAAVTPFVGQYVHNHLSEHHGHLFGGVLG